MCMLSNYYSELAYLDCVTGQGKFAGLVIQEIRLETLGQELTPLSTGGMSSLGNISLALEVLQLAESRSLRLSRIIFLHKAN